MLEGDSTGARHLFSEKMKRLFYAMKEVEPEGLDEKMLDDLLVAVDGVSNFLNKIERKRREREHTKNKLLL